MYLGFLIVFGCQFFIIGLPVSSAFLILIVRVPVSLLLSVFVFSLPSSCPASSPPSLGRVSLQVLFFHCQSFVASLSKVLFEILSVFRYDPLVRYLSISQSSSIVCHPPRFVISLQYQLFRLGCPPSPPPSL